MNKNSIIIFGGLISASIFLVLPNQISAYNYQTVHPALTKEIINFYELSGGKKFTDEQRQWIVQGSVDEDLAPRWLNHFYDPIYERGFQAESIGMSGYSAKNWAQFSSYQKIHPSNMANLWTGNGPVISGSWWGDFSYEAAIKDYSKGKEKEAHVALGHILHLIEDMTVPEHTRNDAHPSQSVGLPSYYENWTVQNSSGLTQDLGKRIYNESKKPITYADLESYFNNLATYTNNYFFSPRTIQSDIYRKPKIVFEDGNFAYGKDENGEIFNLAYTTKDFITQKTTYSIKDNNYQILQEYWLRLSRQAIVNGAGVIGLFLNQAEAAKQVELAQQKVDAQQMAQKSSLISQIYNFLTSPDTSPASEPALVITSELPTAQPKIKPAIQLMTTPMAPLKSEESKPVAINPTSKLTPKSTPAPNLTTTPYNTTAPTTAPAPAPQNQAPQVANPIVYGIGGGGGGGTSSSQNVQNQSSSSNSGSNSNATSSNATSTDNNLNISIFNVGDLVINEIMYNPEGTDDKHEWIELYNNSNRDIVLTGGNDGWKFDDGSTSLHGLNEPPTNGSQGSMAVAPGGYIVLADNAATFLADHSGFNGAAIDTVMDLKNSTSTIRAIKIIAPSGTAIDEVLYSNSWGADGNGKTLERKSAAGGSNDAANWAQSSAPGGTPGAANNYEVAFATSTLDTATSTDSFASATTTLAAATSSPPISFGTDIPATTTISTNTIWTLAGSPYRLFFDGQRRPTVATGAVLTIEPGVKIIPQGGNYTAFEIQGILNAIATSGAPIVFTSINDANGSTSSPQKGDWLNIAFSQGAQANLDYVEFRYGGQGNTLPFREMVDARGATVNINHSKFENSQNTALHLMDSSGVVENSVFSDNNCGISVDSSNGVANTAYGGCYGTHTTGQILSSSALQIKNNQFIRNQLIGIEVRSGTAPVINSNIFTDNSYPIKIESSYPAVTNSQIANSTSSPNVLNGIAISGHTHFSQNYTLKKDLPYILESDGNNFSPYVDSGATLTIEPGAIFKTGHTFSALYINGSLIASSTPDNPIVFTSLKDDSKGGDTNGDGLVSLPQVNDWANIKFFAGSVGSFANTIFNYGGYDSSPTVITSSQVITDFSASSTVSNQNCDAVTSSISSNHNGSFSKVVIHKLTNQNPITTAFFQINVIGGGVIDQVLVQNPGYNSSEVELNFTAGFNSSGQYNIRLLGISEGTITTNCNWGTDVSGNLASTWYESITTTYDSALSIDSGATVVVQ